MKKVWLVAVLCAFVLVGCGTAKSLVNMSMYSTADNGVNNVIEWNGVQYMSLGSVSASLIGEQVGYANGDKNDKIYAARDCSTSEWLIEVATHGDIDSITIFQERSVQSVPNVIEENMLSD